MPKYQLQFTGEQVEALLLILQTLGTQIKDGSSLLTPEQQQALQGRIDDGKLNTLAEIIDFFNGIGEGTTLQQLLDTAQGLSPEDRQLLLQVRQAIDSGDLISEETIAKKVEEYLASDETISKIVEEHLAAQGIATDDDINTIFETSE